MLQSGVSYGYYFNDYNMGQPSILSAQQFSIYEKQARIFLKGICREELPKDSCDDVFACICAIAEALYRCKDRRDIKSENIDGYSVTFADKKGINKDLYSIANLYLGQTGLIYAGVD